MSRSTAYNAERSAMQSLGVGTREETWVINYARNILRHVLLTEHGFKDGYSDAPSPYKACQYKRSENLCYNWLVTRGLYDPETREPVMEKILEVARLYAKAPDFKADGIKESCKIQNTPYQAYENYAHLDARQIFYVYLHQDEYLIHEYRVTEKLESFNSSYGYTRRRNRYFSSAPTERKIEKLIVYPKALYQTLVDNIAHLKIQHLLKEHPQLAARILYGVELNNIFSMDGDWREINRFHGKTITRDDLVSKISQAKEAASFFQRASEELQILLDKMDQAPEIDVNDYDRVIEYFRENGPLYLNEEEKDIKIVARLIMEGAGNERVAFELYNSGLLYV